jgi:hypothetical protein
MPRMRALKLDHPPLTSLVLSTLLALFTVACGDDGNSVAADAAPPDAFVPDAAIAPAFFTPRDDLSDDELADQALTLLGQGAEGESCQDCHGVTRQRLYHWRALSDTALGGCMSDHTNTDPEAARTMIDCLRADADPAMAFHAARLGIFTTGAHLEYFEFMFERAYGSDYATEYEEFLARLAMPQGSAPVYTQAEFDIVASWFTRGVPLTDAKLPPDPAPSECTPGVSASVSDHVAEMAVSGWRAVNEQNGILMFGCNDAESSLDCLSTYPLADSQSFGLGWSANANVPGQQLRLLRESGYRSAFWTRSSADGRWVANGASTGGAPSRIVDLKRDVSIPGSAFYDPGFFPDNSGFMFQRNRAYVCNQSLLVSEPNAINYNQEEECTSTENVGLYQHVGAALGGGDYWSVDGQFTSDNGGKEPSYSDPHTSFSVESRTNLTPLIHNGSSFEAYGTVGVGTPYEGDTIISTSSKMVLSRLRGPLEQQLGFVMREVVATPTDDGYDITLPEVARYCFNGGKPAFSYDERWLVLHHYVGDADAIDLGYTGSEDPGFSDYQSQGSANIYLLDTLTGQVTRLTKMNPGQYALFPHFRSDGWIYFVVRTLGQGSEYIVASDAALRLEAP